MPEITRAFRNDKKVSVHQGDVAILIIDAPHNRASKCSGTTARRQAVDWKKVLKGI